MKNYQIEEPVKHNNIYNFLLVIPRKKKIDKIKFEISYTLENKKELKKKYEIIPIEFTEGEEFSKLCMKEYLSNLPEKEKMDKLIKYQILDEITSLFAEIELSNKITKEMKLKILPTEDNKILNCYSPSLNKKKSPSNNPPIMPKQYSYSTSDDTSYTFGGGDLFDDDSTVTKKVKTKEEEKEDIMKMIKTQDFIEGFWDVNDMNKFIIEKYQKEYNKLKIKFKNDKIIITVLIIYYLNKKWDELLKDIIMIIKKAKAFIQKESKCSYEDIVGKL